MNPSKLKSVISDGKDELAAYNEYNKVLRTWFVGFGIGGPAFFLINQAIGQRLADSGQITLVSSMFLLGSGSQVIGALINKICNWYVYRGANDDEFRKRKRYRFSHWLVHQFWIDIILDLVTVTAFGIAVWHLLAVLAPTSVPQSTKGLTGAGKTS